MPALQPQVIDERLTAINENFKNQILTEEETLLQVKDLIRKIKAETEVPENLKRTAEISSYNLKVYKAFMTDHYEGRPILRPHTIVNEFNYALRAIEPLSVISTAKKALQNRVDKEFNDKQSKRYVGRINQLLEFAGRDFTLFTKKRLKGQIRYVNYDELLTVVSHVTDPNLKNFYTFLFCSGLRLGEAFVIGARDIKPQGTIFISRQMTEKLEIRGVKNGKAHHTIVLKEGMKAAKEWASLPANVKESYRTRCQQPITIAAKKAFPGDSERFISPHDLRHSYAIHLLGLGVSLDKVAKLIGDSIKTTEEYYAGFTMSDNEIDIVRKILANT